MQKKHIVIGILIALLLVGCAMAAESETTTINAEINQQGTISVTAPPTFDWTLQRTGNNQVNIGDVAVESTDPWNLEVSGSHDGFLYHVGPNVLSSGPYTLPVNIYLFENTWGTLTGSNQILMQSTAPAANVPVYLQQIVSPNDQTPATITLTFTGTIP